MFLRAHSGGSLRLLFGGADSAHPKNRAQRTNVNSRNTSMHPDSGEYAWWTVGLPPNGL